MAINPSGSAHVFDWHLSEQEPLEDTPMLESAPARIEDFGDYLHPDLIAKMETALIPYLSDAKGSTTSVPFSPKLLGHVCGDHILASSDELQGLNGSIAYKFLAESASDLLPEKVVLSVSELLKHINMLSVIKAKRDPVEQSRQLDQYCRQLSDLLKEQRTLTLDGGWNNSAGGHSMIYKIDLDESTITLYNTGEGLNYHCIYIRNAKKKYDCQCVIKACSGEILSSPSFIKALLIPKIQKRKPVDGHWSSQIIYDAIIELTQGQVEASEAPSERLVSAQISGTCSWKVLMAYLKSTLDADLYLKIKFRLSLRAFILSLHAIRTNKWNLGNTRFLLECAEPFAGKIAEPHYRNILSQDDYELVAYVLYSIRKMHQEAPSIPSTMPSVKLDTTDEEKPDPLPISMEKNRADFEWDLLPENVIDRSEIDNPMKIEITLTALNGHVKKLKEQGRTIEAVHFLKESLYLLPDLQMYKNVDSSHSLIYHAQICDLMDHLINAEIDPADSNLLRAYLLCAGTILYRTHVAEKFNSLETCITTMRLSCFDSFISRLNPRQTRFYSMIRRFENGNYALMNGSLITINQESLGSERLDFSDGSMLEALCRAVIPEDMRYSITSRCEYLQPTVLFGEVSKYLKERVEVDALSAHFYLYLQGSFAFPYRCIGEWEFAFKKKVSLDTSSFILQYQPKNLPPGTYRIGNNTARNSPTHPRGEILESRNTFLEQLESLTFRKSLEAIDDAFNTACLRTDSYASYNYDRKPSILLEFLSDGGTYFHSKVQDLLEAGYRMALESKSVEGLYRIELLIDQLNGFVELANSLGAQEKYHYFCTKARFDDLKGFRYGNNKYLAMKLAHLQLRYAEKSDVRYSPKISKIYLLHKLLSRFLLSAEESLWNVRWKNRCEDLLHDIPEDQAKKAIIIFWRLTMDCPNMPAQQIIKKDALNFEYLDQTIDLSRGVVIQSSEVLCDPMKIVMRAPGLEQVALFLKKSPEELNWIRVAPPEGDDSTSLFSCCEGLLFCKIRPGGGPQLCVPSSTLAHWARRDFNIELSGLTEGEMFYWIPQAGQITLGKGISDLELKAWKHFAEQFPELSHPDYNGWLLRSPLRVLLFNKNAHEVIDIPELFDSSKTKNCIRNETLLPQNVLKAFAQSGYLDIMQLSKLDNFKNALIWKDANTENIRINFSRVGLSFLWITGSDLHRLESIEHPGYIVSQDPLPSGLQKGRCVLLKHPSGQEKLIVAANPDWHCTDCHTLYERNWNPAPNVSPLLSLPTEVLTRGAEGRCLLQSQDSKLFNGSFSARCALLVQLLNGESYGLANRYILQLFSLKACDHSEEVLKYFEKILVEFREVKPIMCALQSRTIARLLYSYSLNKVAVDVNLLQRVIKSYLQHCNKVPERFRLTLKEVKTLYKHFREFNVLEMLLKEHIKLICGGQPARMAYLDWEQPSYKQLPEDKSNLPPFMGLEFGSEPFNEESAYGIADYYSAQARWALSCYDWLDNCYKLQKSGDLEGLRMLGLRMQLLLETSRASLHKNIFWSSAFLRVRKIARELARGMKLILPTFEMAHGADVSRWGYEILKCNWENELKSSSTALILDTAMPEVDRDPPLQVPSISERQARIRAVEAALERAASSNAKETKDAKSREGKRLRPSIDSHGPLKRAYKEELSDVPEHSSNRFDAVLKRFSEKIDSMAQTLEGALDLVLENAGDGMVRSLHEQLSTAVSRDLRPPLLSYRNSESIENFIDVLRHRREEAIKQLKNHETKILRILNRNINSPQLICDGQKLLHLFDQHLASEISGRRRFLDIQDAFLWFLFSAKQTLDPAYADLLRELNAFYEVHFDQAICSEALGYLSHVEECSHDSAHTWIRRAIDTLCKPFSPLDAESSKVDRARAYFQIMTGMTLRQKQLDILKRSVGDGSVVQQLACGEGKSSVITRILFLMSLADGKTVLNVVPQPQITNHLQSVQQGLEELGPFHAAEFRFSRQTQLNSDILKRMVDFFQNAKEEGTLIVTSPESMESLLLKFFELMLEASRETTTNPTQNAAPLAALRKIFALLKDEGCCIADEFDHIMRALHELNYALSDMASLPEFRRKIPSLIFELLLNLEPDHEYWTESNYRSGLQTLLVDLLIKSTYFKVPKDFSEGFREYLQMVQGVSPTPLCISFQKWMEEQPEEQQEAMKLCRAQLCFYLPFCLSERHYVDYGPNTDKDGGQAIPYDGNMSPIAGSSFAFYDSLVNFTWLSYLKHGLSKTEVFRLVDLWCSQDHEYRKSHSGKVSPMDRKFKSYMLGSIQGGLPLRFVTPGDFSMMETIYQHLRLNSSVISEYLDHTLIPDFGVQQQKLHASGVDLFYMFRQVLGLSGNLSNHYHYPFQAKVHLDTASDSEALQRLTDPQCTELVVHKRLKWKRIAHTPDLCALLDPFGSLQGMKNEKVARKLIKQLPDNISGVVYFADASSQRRILGRDGKTYRYREDSFEPEKYIIYFDQKHCRGEHFPPIAKGKGILLANSRLPYTDLQQASMRLRNYGQGQVLSIALLGGVDQEIKESTGVDQIDLSAVLAWSILNEGKHLDKTVASGLGESAKGQIRSSFMTKLLSTKSKYQLALFRTHQALAVEPLNHKLYLDHSDLAPPLSPQESLLKLTSDLRSGGILSESDQRALDVTCERAKTLLSCEHVFMDSSQLVITAEQEVKEESKEQLENYTKSFVETKWDTQVLKRSEFNDFLSGAPNFSKMTVRVLYELNLIGLQALFPELSTSPDLFVSANSLKISNSSKRDPYEKAVELPKLETERERRVFLKYMPKLEYLLRVESKIMDLKKHYAFIGLSRTEAGRVFNFLRFEKEDCPEYSLALLDTKGEVFESGNGIEVPALKVAPYEHMDENTALALAQIRFINGEFTYPGPQDLALRNWIAGNPEQLKFHQKVVSIRPQAGQKYGAEDSTIVDLRQKYG